MAADVAHRVEQQAHVGQRGPARLLDVAEGAPQFRVRIGELVPHGADLEDHDADGMGDGVVQLAGDPGAFLGRHEHDQNIKRVPARQ